ncbi:hypothetical protein HAX54_007351, partial [Datura stramonium]|nr:hypothetical protein [Datura stramonium]
MEETFKETPNFYLSHLEEDKMCNLSSSPLEGTRSAARDVRGVGKGRKGGIQRNVVEFQVNDESGPWKGTHQTGTPQMGPAWTLPVLSCTKLTVDNFNLLG